jgi:7-cyano-7-deazaguanine synthase
VTTPTLVLLSGGLDSTAALLWALRTDAHDVRAIFLHYGQPASEREVRRAIAVTQALDVPFYRSDLSGAFYGATTGLFQPKDSAVVAGLDVAFVPSRNLLLLAAAVVRARVLWPTGPVKLVVGFNQDDAGGFPDCTLDFLDATTGAVNQGLGPAQGITIRAPWAEHPKREVVDWVRKHAPERFDLVEQSWSCYQPNGPCGKCTACVVRARAFACKFCPRPPVAGCDEQCEACFADNSLSASGGY